MCAIIKACHKSGVTSLKFGDVEVTFGTEPQTLPIEWVSRETPPVVPQKDLGQVDVTMALSSEEKKMLDDMEVVDMSISDPVAFENYSVDQLVHGGRSLDG